MNPVCILAPLVIFLSFGIILSLAVILSSDEDYKRATHLIGNVFVQLAQLAWCAIAKLRLASEEQVQASSIGVILTLIAYFTYRGWL